MSIENTISEFYESVKKAGEILSDYQKDIDNRHEQIQECIKKIKPVEMPDTTASSELSEYCERLFEKYNRTISIWQNGIEKYISGKEFVNKFEKSLLLIVFADVKAGKSSLGNFVSGYALKGTPFEHLYTEPECYAYDYTDKSLNCGEETRIDSGFFVEDEIQATASIQYFTLLNGLTWVDTPGIHSLTTEYEELAKDYVKYADLILFLTPSNNPIKMDEAYEIKKLVKCDKPMLIAITKSDISKKRVVNGKLATVLTAKSDNDRTAQEEYTKERISEIGQGNIISQNEYISISTKIAKKAIAENDDEFFEQSNFPAFFKQIGNVISEKAIALKMKRPKDELNTVVDEIICGNDSDKFIGIVQLRENIMVFIEDIDNQIKKIEMLKPMILSDVSVELNNRIYSLLYSEKISGNLTNKNYISDKISELINNVVKDTLTEIISREIADFQYIQTDNAHIFLNADFKVKKQKLEYQIQEVRDGKRAPRGIIENIQSFFGREFYECKVKNITKSHEIEIGDNFSEYVNTTMEDVKPHIVNIIDAEIEKIKNQYFGVLKNSVDVLNAQLIEIENELKAIKY